MPRSLLPQMFLWCLVPLAACGVAVPVASPAASSPIPVVSAKSAIILPAVSPNAASPERSSGFPSAPARRVSTVVLDPGHNGGNASHPAEMNRQVPDGRGGTKACNTTGTSTNGGYQEHAFNWDVALRVRDALTARGVRVVLTRPDDAGIGPCVNDRAEMANRVGAAAVISIHADGARPSGHGFHIAYSDPPLNASQGPPSVALADALAKAFRDKGFSASNYVGSAGRNPRPDLAGLNLATVPAALVECANMRNPQEAALVSTPDGRTRYATAIADGVVAWLTSRS